MNEDLPVLLMEQVLRELTFLCKELVLETGTIANNS